MVTRDTQQAVVGVSRAWRGVALGLVVGIVAFAALRRLDRPPEIPPDPVKQLESAPIDPRLAAVVPVVDFDRVKLQDAITFLAVSQKLNVVFRWDKMGEQAVTSQSPVTLHLTNVSLHAALDEVMVTFGKGWEIGWTFRDNILTVTSRTDLTEMTSVTRIYDVRSLLGEAENLSARFAPANFVTSNPPFSGVVPGAGPSSSEAEKAGELIDIIENQISQASWRNNGGDDGDIHYFNGNLTVTASEPMQFQVQQFLQLLRHSH